jgi:predicted transglutaminase-like protease
MFLGSRGRPVRRADNLTAICEPIVQTMWNPQHVTTLWSSRSCYGDSFTLLYFYCHIIIIIIIIICSFVHLVHLITPSATHTTQRRMIG